ncbi:hypothetical protein ACWEQC_42720 [Streptomyces shenzhenensis]
MDALAPARDALETGEDLRDVALAARVNTRVGFRPGRVDAGSDSGPRAARRRGGPVLGPRQPADHTNPGAVPGIGRCIADLSVADFVEQGEVCAHLVPYSE